MNGAEYTTKWLFLRSFRGLMCLKDQNPLQVGLLDQYSALTVNSDLSYVVVFIIMTW